MFNFCSYFINFYFVVVVVAVECRRIRFSVQIACEQFCGSHRQRFRLWMHCMCLVCMLLWCVCEREINLVWPAHVIAFAKSDREYFCMFSILFLSVSFTRCSKIGFFVRLRVSSQYLHRSGFCVCLFFWSVVDSLE